MATFKQKRKGETIMNTRQTWDKKVAPGDKVTCVGFLTIAGQKKTKESISRFSSFLSSMVRKGEATRIQKVHGTPVQYQKAGGQKQAKPRTRKDPQVQEFNLLELGESVIQVIDAHKGAIETLKDQIRQLNADVKTLVYQKRQLEELYQGAQERILALNTGKGRTFNLAELQQLRDNLPANGESGA